MEPIRFYSVSQPFGEFSNFARYSIFVDGKRWPTSEHYFQACKFEDDAYREEIRSEPSPKEAANLGRSRKVKLRSNWESMKDNVMRKAIHAKFTQHEELRTLLLSTGEAPLIEHTANDSYWGDGGDGSGKNLLGRLLVELREQLKNG
jgi:N-glycosidase YbiA